MMVLLLQLCNFVPLVNSGTSESNSMHFIMTTNCITFKIDHIETERSALSFGSFHFTRHFCGVFNWIAGIDIVKEMCLLPCWSLEVFVQQYMSQ
eukprot:m.324318 g.324318  ORF g.324318 m.324318 type:complete len:94 (+) comp16541_c0_seq10:2745-3026(+)